MLENNETLTHILTAIGTLTIVTVCVGILLAAGGLVLFFTDLSKIKHITNIETRIDSCLQSIAECVSNDSTAQAEYLRHWDSYKTFKTKTQERLDALEKSKAARDERKAIERGLRENGDDT